MSFNLAELFEQVADAVPERTAIVVDDRRLTFADLEERANRLAHHLTSVGVGPGDHIGVHLKNGNEYLEAMIAAFKVRAVPVNINYRYVERELDHLYRSLDLVAVVVHGQFASSAAALALRLDTLRHVLLVDDGTPAGVDSMLVDTIGYEAALANSDAIRDFEGRGSDDVYCACTGGTTGMPKGVLWRHEDIFFASLGGGDPLMIAGPISKPDEIVGRLPDIGLIGLVPPPLMHVSAHWTAFNLLYGGGTVVLPKPGAIDPSEVWRLVDVERVNLLVLVGDAMARPLIEELASHPSDTSSLFAIGSGGAVLSPSTKDRIKELLPNIIIIDGFGSTETGVTGSGPDEPRGATRDTRAGGYATFRMDSSTKVLDEQLTPVLPGSGITGRLARTGHIPLGYYNDPEKTAATFVESAGVRWVLSGDVARVNADGMIELVGRGSVSINTGGEKVFPEEVESAIVAHSAVDDVVVVGVPDERWGERVAAVIALKAGRDLTLQALQEHCRQYVAGYKVPRVLIVVPTVERNPNGKADYTWARQAAVAFLGELATDEH